MVEALFYQCLDVLFVLDAAPPFRDHVHGGRLSRLAAEQVVDRHPRHLALDVPQGLVDAADGVVEDGAVAPVGGHVAGLPYVLDFGRVLADEAGFQVIVDGFGHGRHP